MLRNTPKAKQKEWCKDIFETSDLNLKNSIIGDEELQIYIS